MDAGPEPQDKPKLNKETVSIVPQRTRKTQTVSMML